MEYKAAIFDLDGTAILNREDGMPSARLISAVNKIKDRIIVAAATGRPISNCRHILKTLKLTSPCIISGGTQIIDPLTEKIIWEKQLSIEQVRGIIDIATPFEYQLYFSNETESSLAKARLVKSPETIIYIMTVSKDGAQNLLSALNKITGIAAHPVPSWTPKHFDIHIVHKEATKKHALELWLELLNLKREEVVGFGDGNNDLPIFESVGYKVAMSNATDDLKAKADLIAENENNEGVAQVMEKIFT
ncbi:MAG: HAD family phosphatase [Candidatus Doudnabacteria bacterium]|nr:HAD family phosphatase [Candidatus Doudnabacteria bacterium]